MENKALELIEKYREIIREQIIEYDKILRLKGKASLLSLMELIDKDKIEDKSELRGKIIKTFRMAYQQAERTRNRRAMDLIESQTSQSSTINSLNTTIGLIYDYAILHNCSIFSVDADAVEKYKEILLTSEQDVLSDIQDLYVNKLIQECEDASSIYMFNIVYNDELYKIRLALTNEEEQDYYIEILHLKTSDALNIEDISDKKYIYSYIYRVDLVNKKVISFKVYCDSNKCKNVKVYNEASMECYACDKLKEHNIATPLHILEVAGTVLYGYLNKRTRDTESIENRDKRVHTTSKMQIEQIENRKDVVIKIGDYVSLTDSSCKGNVHKTHASPREHVRRGCTVHRKNGTTYTRRGCTVNKGHKATTYKIKA